ncbi:hypothetical protein WEH80_14450 [Actinomycetes bacterium KLBMP 9759]
MIRLMTSLSDRLLDLAVPRTAARAAGCIFEPIGCCDWKVVELWNFCTGERVCVTDHSQRCT